MGKTRPEKKREAAEAAAVAEVAATSKPRWPVPILGFSAIVLVLAFAIGWARPSASGEETKPLPDDGLGPRAMASQGPLLKRLIALLKEVEDLPAEDFWEDRMAASRRVEDELHELEGMIEDRSSTAGKQHLALITLARSALEDDRSGTNKTADWNEEKLFQDHGLVTYASKSYWEEAYGAGKYGESFDWFGGWEEPDISNATIAEVFRSLHSKDQKILMMGCGISNVSAHMYREGYTNIMNIDVSEAAITQMQQLWGHLEGMQWKAMNAGALDFPDDSFDVVLEKGMFDALYAGTGSQALPVMAEARRVLRKSGSLFSISFGEDRIERLYAPSSEEDGVAPEMKCTTPAKLQFKQRKKKNATEEQETALGKPIFLYSCEKL